MSDQIEKIKEEYRNLCHAMQTGVGFSEPFAGDMTPKHLRVGINSALCDSAALAGLLMKKGIFTELEYYTALRDMMKAEVQRYTDQLQGHYNRPVKLL